MLRSLAGLAVLVAVLAGCGGTAGTTDTRTGAAAVSAPVLSERAKLGQLIFNDKSLSASGRVACASCHDPAHGFAQSDGQSVPSGGIDGISLGQRNSPSLKYLVFNPAFFFDSEGTPTGGFNRDGRAKSLAEQSERAFLTSFEMANTSADDVAEKLSRATYAAEFRKQFGDQIFSDAVQAFYDAREALQSYQLETQSFAPFTSKYDYFLAGRAQLSAQELNGLALYNNPLKGDCAACHPSRRSSDGTPPMFTDFTYDNLGVPRNASIPDNDDPNYFDLGLCGPLRTDLADRNLCGAFKVPTLRNIALTGPYFHNGYFGTLKEVVGFYVRRDTNPGEWYPIGANGLPDKFNDLPDEFKKNVNITEVPYNRHLGDEPALSPAEIDDVVAFLQTLTDGYQP